MQLSCLQENLSRGLSVVQRAVATRTTLPITQNVLLSTDNSRLKLAATNLEIAISTWIGAQVEEEGSITIPARLLTEFVNSLPVERIDIAMNPQPLGLDLECARFEAHINGRDADDFPPIPTVESGVIGKISSSVLKDAITHVAFAAATEESRPVLTGIKVDLKGDSFTFAAADGFRLAVYEGKLAEAVSEDVSFIMPARAFQEVNRLIGTDDTTIEFTVTPSKSQALFRLDNVELVSQLIQGTFPNYSQLIPEGHDTRAVVDQTAFLSATRTASIFARDGSGIVRLNVLPAENGSGGKLSISSRAEELGDNQGEIDASVEGDESKIAFNSKYLSEVLDVLGPGEIALETTTSSSPGVIRPVSKEGYIHVVMPMFVQW
ncbi:MAG: DNA polymerase III subunit beta [SAR202 cluster bacterium]|nr:DNA polymerase III subunit beta [SAR202 cluster bacterium]